MTAGNPLSRTRSRVPPAATEMYEQYEIETDPNFIPDEDEIYFEEDLGPIGGDEIPDNTRYEEI